jgi:Glycosyltransferase like family
MIAFGSSITSPEVYERCAERGFHLVAEPNSEILAQPSAGSIYRNYNLILERAGELDELEALVLVHQDAEIVDPDFCRKLRRGLSDPQVGVVGCVGAIGVRSIAWWEGSVTWASFSHRYGELDGEEFPSLSWNGEELPPYARTGEVDTVDGFVLGISPWTVKNIRFDESLGQLLHGYDFDFCLQVRAAGRRVVTEDFKVIHHHSLELADDLEHWVEAHMSVSEKWDGHMPNVGVAAGDWKQRARRAEAEAAAARAQALSTELRITARTRDHERQVRELTDSISWRITAPLRRLEALRAARRRRRPRGSVGQSRSAGP